jgi:ech hydrogenase subunit D
MIEQQTMVTCNPQEMTAKTTEMFAANARLVQIGCTNMGETLEVNYSFDINYQFTNFRVLVPAKGAVLPSISSIYFCAAIYENELKDLFGINFQGLILDYQGQFYRKAMPTPFNPGN